MTITEVLRWAEKKCSDTTRYRLHPRRVARVLAEEVLRLNKCLMQQQDRLRRTIIEKESFE